MSTSPEDLPVSRGRAARVRAAARAASRTRTRSEIVDSPVVADELTTEAPPDSRPDTVPPVVTSPTRTDGNGSGTKLPKAARRDRKEPKVVATPAGSQHLDRRFRQTITKVDLWSV